MMYMSSKGNKSPKNISMTLSVGHIEGHLNSKKSRCVCETLPPAATKSKLFLVSRSMSRSKRH